MALFPVLLCLAAASAGDDPLDELRPRLADASPRTRRSAVRKTAAIATREAWLLVLDALQDEEPEVGDAAQLALGGLERDDVLSELLGRRGLGSRDQRVRWRAAEALGRVPVPVSGKALARRLSTRDAPLARLLLWSVERLAARECLDLGGGEIERAVLRIHRARRYPELRGDALVALAALGSPRVRELGLDALGSRDPELRIATLLAARLAGLEEERAWAEMLVSDSDPRVRLQALESLEGLATLAGLRVLVGRLEVEERLRLRWRVLLALKRLSGMKYRFDPRPWKLWVDQQDDEWRPERSAPDAPKPGDTQAEGLAQLPVRSDRVCFLFDFSGSMWSRLPDGRTPKEIVDLELRVALERLPEDTEFNVVPYTHEPHPWEPEVRPAGQRNVRSALEFFERCREAGRGNFWDAARFALADPRVDTLVVLTDGVPTGGSHCDMDLILSLFGHANRYCKVTVDSILVDAPGGAVRRWTELSRRTDGQVIEVELD